MQQTIYIEWSGKLDNDIMALARNENSYLQLSNCIYCYVYVPEDTTYREFPELKFVDYLHGSIYYDTIKDKLIENLGRSEIQEINNSTNWNLSLIIGKVLNKDGEIVSEQLMKSVCAQLTQDHIEEENKNGSNHEKEFEFVHLFGSSTDGFLKRQEAV